MPRRERSERSRGLTAAAKNYTTGRSQKKVAEKRVRGGEDWQNAGWDFYDVSPEYHQGCEIVGALLSRAALTIEERGTDGVWKPTENSFAKQALDELYGGEEGHAEMLRLFGTHFSVAGEGWLFGPGDTSEDGPDDWLVASPTEVAKSGNTWRVAGETLPGTPLAVRIWKRHPRDPKKADSPTRAILPILSSLLQLSKREAAQIDSRLTGAGLLLMPSETEFSNTPMQQLNPGDPAVRTDSLAPGDAQGMVDILIENAKLAIANPEAPEAMIPIMATMPGEYIEKAKLLTFWSELDKLAPTLREEAIRRIAFGMDIPPEVLLGGQGSNHWNMWLSDENSVKIHAEPLLKIITSGLTTGYLRPSLEGVVADPRMFRIGSDTSQMRMRPNRSKEAMELYDRMVLSREAVLRENGFGESDLMGDEERQVALMLKAASGSTTPEIVEAALREAGLDLNVQITDLREPAEARPTPSLKEHPVRELPERSPSATQAAAAAGLVYAAEQMVDRALQRAGNRLKTKFGMRGQLDVSANRLYMTVEVGAGDVDDILQDAFGACLEFDYGVPPAALQRALEMYTRSLIVGRREPSRKSLAAALKLLLNESAA